MLIDWLGEMQKERIPNTWDSVKAFLYSVMKNASALVHGKVLSRGL